MARESPLTELQKFLLYSYLLDRGMNETATLFRRATKFNPPSNQTTFEFVLFDLLHHRARELSESYIAVVDGPPPPPHHVESSVAAADRHHTESSRAAVDDEEDDYHTRRSRNDSSAAGCVGSPREVDRWPKWATYIVMSVLLGSLLTWALGDLRLRVQMVVVFAVFFIHLGCPEWVVTWLYAFIILGGCLFVISLSIVSLVTTLLGYLDILVGYLHILLGYLRLVAHILVISIIIFIHLWAYET